MYQIDFKKPVTIHFIGIGGISMSGLAQILLKEGFTVKGSDSKESELTKELIADGAIVAYGQKAENITEDIDLVVYTAAIHPDNPEYAQSVKMGIPMITRAELLGQIMKNYKLPVAVSGTHGKTTTTSMLTMMLLAEDADPTISVGGILSEIGGNIRIGSSDIFVTEACEYTNSFLSFFPKISIILNIEEDHLDFFKDINDIRNSFHTFAALLPKDGTLVINNDIENLQEITKDLPCNVLTVSSKEDIQGTCPDYSAANVTYNEFGCASFDVCKGGKAAYRVCLSVPGSHNVTNALAAIAAAETMGISEKGITEGLHKFTGTDRRFQKKGEIAGVTVIDDYAHHPTEIRATLSAARKVSARKLWVVFQPHTYTRTKSLFSDFVDALSMADAVVLADIYAARETDTLGMSSDLLRQALSDRGVESYYFPSFDAIENFLLQNCEAGDLLITMGAGDIVKVGENLLGL